MQFGTQQVFDYIKYNLEFAEDGSWYDRLYAVVKGDVMGYLSVYKLQDSDKKDIFHNVMESVYRHLPRFAADPKSKTKVQRNAWLCKIIKSKVMDFFRKEYKNFEDSIDEVALNRKKEKKHLCYNNIEEKIKVEAAEIRLIKALTTIFSINTTPDKIIAFVFNRIISTDEHSRINGTPKELSEKYCGLSIQEMFYIMKNELQGLVPFRIPDRVYSPLIKKIKKMTQDGGEDILFDLSPRSITDSSNWITKKIKEKEGGK